ncbi:hypothetical protein, partial [Salmonella sp. s51884]|uniref:hypothetical protein n=1 Tax=Salmonella sp. s51884 TaxID=3159654 RepID=UPI0039811E15
MEFVEDPLNLPTIVQDYIHIINTCEALVPKPMARICTASPLEHQKCITMRNVFQSDVDLKIIAWGCVLARTKMDCMRNFLDGTADLYSGDVKEVFIGGHDLQLQPMMVQDEDLRLEPNNFHNATVKSHTIAVMKK